MFNKRSKIIESRSPGIRIFLSRLIIQKIFHEVDEAEELRPNFETGGSFLGKIGANGNVWENMQILSVIPPGPEAVYKRNYCSLDREFQGEMIRVCQKKNKEISYCGDWHYHPYTMENPSSGDLAEDMRNVASSLPDSLQKAGFLYAIVSLHHRSRLFSWLSLYDELISDNQKWKIKFFFLLRGAKFYCSFIPEIVDSPMFYPNCCDLERELALISICYKDSFSIVSETIEDGFFSILLTKTFAHKHVSIKFLLAPSFPYEKPEVLICVNRQRWFSVDQLTLLERWHPDFHIVNLIHDICRQMFPENF